MNYDIKELKDILQMNQATLKEYLNLHLQDLGSQLRNGNPAAHGKIRLMLLGSPPDMVHGFPLRETVPSTLFIKSRQYTIQARVWGFIPAVADCRHRAPLSPRLVRPCYEPVLL